MWRFYIRYDADGIVVNVEELEVTEEEAHRVRENERAAYEVILSA